MPSLDVVRLVLNRLAPRGWKQLLEKHGFNVDTPDLGAELTRRLVDQKGKTTIDRGQPGFEDLSLAARAAIEPGNPGLSVLYHALASPNVYPNPTGPRTNSDFPTLEELDAIENYIYGLANRKLADFNNPVIAVFAYQYRAGTRSVHRAHADMVFSRTGIARVGTTAMHYDSVRRSFWIESSGNDGLAVMPARYAAFIAERRHLSNLDDVVHPIGGEIPQDKQRTFLIPVHKLFAGDECLVGEHIQQITFVEYHRSEKLRKIHELSPQKGGIQLFPGFNLNQPPFVRESADLVKLHSVGASTLLIPNPRPTLAETVTQHNSVSGKEEIVRFRVPPENSAIGGGRGNRFDESSFQIPATNVGRAASEYAHMRLHVRPSGQLFDVNSLGTPDFKKVLKDARFVGITGIEDGPLEAAHLVDNTCEGAIAAQVTLSKALSRYSAASFVAAPDFLPLVDQLEIQRWAEARGLAGPGVYFSEGGPEPLCYGRDVVPNPTLLNPLTHAGSAFERTDVANNTITAVVSPASQSNNAPPALAASVSTSFLPDAAAGVFQPGWDTSMFHDRLGDFYVNFGLGSPFPEDAKLCAALNSFWPAAAPDVGRTFGGMTAVPLLDEELGFHPMHPRVLSGQAISGPGWDGEFGPFITANDRVNISSLVRSDYTVNALHGKIGIGLLGRIDSVEQLARMDAFRECTDQIRGSTPMTKFKTVLVSAEKVKDWSLRTDRFDKTLTGPGYSYIFCDIVNINEDASDVRRQVGDVRAKFICQISAGRIGIQKDSSPPRVLAIPKS